MTTSKTAGEIYDVMSGERQYARVDGDRVLSIGGYSALPPGADWLPVEFQDSEPFDAKLHFRECPPTAEVRGDRVVRTFQVRAKRPDESEWEGFIS
jgi:hypothetical protein